MKRLVYVIPLALLAAGCADQSRVRTDPTYEAAVNNLFIPTNYRAAEALLIQAQASLVQDVPLIVTTVVDINDLEKSSALGRTISEMISAQFTRSGYRTVEMKFRSTVYIRRTQGELSLTREIKELAQSYNAQAVLVGTYSMSRDFVYVNLKVIRPGDNIVLAAHYYTLPNDTNISGLLTR